METSKKWSKDRTITTSRIVYQCAKHAFERRTIPGGTERDLNKILPEESSSCWVEETTITYYSRK